MENSQDEPRAALERLLKVLPIFRTIVRVTEERIDELRKLLNDPDSGRARHRGNSRRGKKQG